MSAPAGPSDGRCGSLLIRSPVTVAKESRAKTMRDPEVMMASHFSAAGGARVLMVSEVDVTVTAPGRRKPRPFPWLSHQHLRFCFSVGPTFSSSSLSVVLLPKTLEEFWGI